MTLYEVDEAANRIREEVDPDANIIFGSTFDEKLTGKVRVSIVATGIDSVLPAHAARSLNASGPFTHKQESHLAVIDPLSHQPLNDDPSHELTFSLLGKSEEQDDFFSSETPSETFPEVDDTPYDGEDLSEPLTLEKEEKKLSLFQRLTGVHRRSQQSRIKDHEEAHFPAEHADFSHAAFSDKDEDDIEDLEIPAFLRRQDHK